MNDSFSLIVQFSLPIVMIESLFDILNFLILLIFLLFYSICVFDFKAITISFL